MGNYYKPHPSIDVEAIMEAYTNKLLNGFGHVGSVEISDACYMLGEILTEQLGESESYKRAKQKLANMSPENKEKATQAFEQLFDEVDLITRVFEYIVDDNNYLPGHEEVVISMPHEMFEDILDWLKEGDRLHDEPTECTCRNNEDYCDYCEENRT